MIGVHNLVTRLLSQEPQPVGVCRSQGLRLRRAGQNALNEHVSQMSDEWRGILCIYNLLRASLGHASIAGGWGVYTFESR